MLKRILHASRSLGQTFFKQNFSSFTHRARMFKLRNLAFAFLSASIAAIMLVSLPNLSPANAVSIRSAATDGCVVDVGNSSLASVTKSGNNCVVTITGSTTITFPSYVSSAGVILVGGGGGGGTDGGGGGGGGEVRYSSSIAVTAGQTATITTSLWS